MSEQWYQNWFDENYLKLYSHRNTFDANNQLNLIIKTLKPAKSDFIADIACGQGRHCALLQEKGYKIQGFDLSETLINSGKKLYPDLDIKIGDMRNIVGKYDIILSLFTSFGYFENDEENLSVFSSISNALNQEGYFWFDFLNSYYVKENLVPKSAQIMENGTKVTSIRRIENDMVIKDILFDTKEKYMEKVKLYTKDKLEEMLNQSGIKLLGSFGDYCGEKWTKASKRTILYGKKV